MEAFTEFVDRAIDSKPRRLTSAELVALWEMCESVEAATYLSWTHMQEQSVAEMLRKQRDDASLFFWEELKRAWMKNSGELCVSEVKHILVIVRVLALWLRSKDVPLTVEFVKHELGIILCHDETASSTRLAQPLRSEDDIFHFKQFIREVIALGDEAYESLSHPKANISDEARFMMDLLEDSSDEEEVETLESTSVISSDGQSGPVLSQGHAEGRCN